MTTASSRGRQEEGAVPASTLIMFAIGGYAYSLAPNPWAWLTSREAAEQMAEEVRPRHSSRYLYTVCRWRPGAASTTSTVSTWT